MTSGEKTMLHEEYYLISLIYQNMVMGLGRDLSFGNACFTVEIIVEVQHYSLGYIFVNET